MLRGVKALLCSLILLALLGGCAVIDTIEPRYDVVNRSTARARNESILLNIIRASHSAPLNFVAFTHVAGTNSINASAGLPQFNLGQFFPLFSPTLSPTNLQTSALAPPSPQRAFTLGNSTLSGGGSANASYDIGILETQDFYLGLLKPVDLATVNFFIRQGYSRELLFWLFTDSVRETIMGQTFEFVNDPNPDLACQMVQGVQRCFSDMVEVAIASGLTIETKVEDKSKSGSEGNTKTQATTKTKIDEGKTGGGKTGGGKTGDGKAGEGKAGEGKAGEGKSTQTIEVTNNITLPAAKSSDSKSGDSSGSKKTEYARFCFDDVLAARALREYGQEILRYLIPGLRIPRCKITRWDTSKPETDTLIFTFAGTPYGTITYEIVPRSAYGIYQYLGKILAANQQQILRLRGSRFAASEDRRILAVERSGTGGCLVDVNFEDEYYCVPLHGAEQTKRIMGLLAQLIAINTNTKDLAITPTARIIQ
jgi:hypothetical protein